MGYAAQLIPSAIAEQDAATVLADLIENAIISTDDSSSSKHILVGFGAVNGIPTISIYDSGVPFPQEVIDAWGKMRITMHEDDGGSGIGMMSTHDICKRYSASFHIEIIEKPSIYTKCVSIRLDQKSDLYVGELIEKSNNILS